MKLIKSEEEIYQNISTVKRNTVQYTTNFYLSGLKLKELIDNKKLFIINNSSNIFILRENDEFYNLYFCSSNNDTLSNSLESEDLEGINLPVVADLVGEEKPLQILKDIFIKNNFHHYSTFIRFSTKMNKYNNILYSTDDILFAEPIDSLKIYSILINNFDKYVHHLPTIGEIEDFIKQKSILIKKENGDIVGLLIFHRIGLSSTASYVYVDKNHRGKKISAKLHKRYDEECHNIKRFLLWVEESNLPVINMQLNWGYNYDNLIDYIMIKRS